MDTFGITALMAVPLIMRDQVFGILLVDRFGEPKPFTELQLDFLEKAAATLSLALENARLYETEREIADRLQEALLSMPSSVDGIEFAHAYHSATEGTRVGGDFYDLFELGPHHVGITVGDVAGKGLDAAVLTSLVRNTVRAHATEMSKTPSQVIALTNEVVHKTTPPEAFATVFFGVLDLRDGRLVYTNAGHTTAAIIRRGRDVEPCGGTGPIVGGFADMEFGESEAHLGSGDLLFLYTDGLTEARRDGEFYGEKRLFGFLSAGRASNGELAGDVVSDVVGDVISFSRGSLRDDMAILAIEARSLGDPQSDD
jgi:serine phosphatase RsbU (regulator of sigma subunit)